MLGKMDLGNVWLVCLVLHTMQVLLVMGVQKFEQQPSYTEVNPGQDALLLCKVFHKRGFCSWQKDNKPVGMYMHKYEWSGTQETGDCSLWIRAAQLEFDDGTWECQVTASDFHTQDALTSAPIKLVVRVPPQRPRIEYNASQILPGHNLTSLHGEVAVIKCISHYGNPPPVLKWFLDQNEITPTRRQSNSTELDNPRTWLAISILELTISKENHGRTLRCVAVHESYSTKSSSIEVRLDVMFPPETRLIGIPTNDIEELRDSVAIRCVTAANPRAIVLWKREGQTQPASMQELLQFSPVVRQHAGLYTCQAKNKAGESSPIRMHIDVKYAPKILSIGPDRLTTAALFTSATFECVAEGNPQPTYQWLQRLPTPSDVIVERGREAKLHINNVTYDFQGEYVCKVTNIISGTERTVQSEAVALQVVGAPQVLRHSATPEVVVEQGQDAQISLVVCADPRPRVVAWEWGSLRLEAGSEMGRYRVDEVLQEDREDCYLATLRIRDAESTDSRAYYLAVENDRGTDRHAIRLYVNEPLQMSTLVSLAGAVLASFILLVCAFIYAIRTEKCCFARKGDFKPTDLDSQKLDIEKTATTGPGGIPADAIYTTAPRTGAVTAGRSPEAMKLSFIPTTTTTTTTTTKNHHLNNTTTPQPFNYNYPHQQQKQKSYVMETTPTPAFRPLSYRYQPPPTAQPRQQVSNDHPPQPPPHSFYESDNTDDPELLQMTYPNPTNKTYCSFNKYQPTPDKTRYDPHVLSNNTANSQSLPGSQRCFNSNKSKHSNRDRRRPLQADNERYYDHIFPTYKTVGNDNTAGGVTSFKRHQDGRHSYNSVYYQPESYRDHAEL